MFSNEQQPLGSIPIVLCLDSSPVKEPFPLRLSPQCTRAARCLPPFLGCHVGPARSPWVEILLSKRQAHIHLTVTWKLCGRKEGE